MISSTQITPPTEYSTPVGLMAWVQDALKPALELDTPIEAAGRRREARLAAAAELLRLQEAETTDLPALIAAEAEARKNLDRITPVFQTAKRGYELASGALSRRSHDLDYAKTLATRAIEASAEPMIDEFASRLLDLHLVTMKITVDDEERHDGYDARSSTPLFAVWSNQPSIVARTAAVLDAYRLALAMKADPDQDDVRARLSALLDDLPDASVMVEVYSPPAREPSRKWPTYEESRAEPKRSPFMDGIQSILVRFSRRTA